MAIFNLGAKVSPAQKQVLDGFQHDGSTTDYTEHTPWSLQPTFGIRRAKCHVPLQRDHRL
jgi:hypothetical protein